MGRMRPCPATLGTGSGRGTGNVRVARNATGLGSTIFETAQR